MMEFQDDGGTRAWRANQATFAPVVDVGKRPRKPMSQWTIKETLCVLFALLVIGTFGSGVILFGGIALLGLFATVTGH